jgi:hypothetical protein
MERLVLSAPSMKLAARLFGLVALTLVAACAADQDPIDEEGSSLAQAPLPDSDGDNLVGDEGPTAESREIDPSLDIGALAKLRKDLDDAEPAPKKVLELAWKGQETGYWCGPGSTRMAIDTRLDTLPSQTELANYMGTTTAGTARAEVVKALNKWLNPAEPYVSIPVDMVPTDAQRELLKTKIVARISAGWPVVANVLSGWRPPGYPTGTIGHFVAVVGYDESGEKVMIADPAGAGAAGPRWKNVPKTYWISMHDLGTWVGGRGYTG